MTHSLRALILTAALMPSIAYAAPAPREMRVALLGDSLAYGAGDESGKGLAGRLEPELRSRGIDSIVATNFGATGATTGDVQARLRHAATRTAIQRAHAIVLSIGANDVRRPLFSGELLGSPLDLADQVLRNVGSIVTELRRINTNARILILGAYIPVRHDRAAILLEPLVAMWDAALMAQFVDDPLVTVVRMSDIIDRPERLSRLDSFHPGGEAYQETARRIAELIAVAPAAEAQAPARPPALH